MVCRLLDAQGQLLGWVEHYARIRGDGCLRADGDVSILVECDGMAAVASLHWADVNAETRVPLDVKVKAGDTLTIFRRGSVMVVVGRIPEGLPPVTVRNVVSVGIPVGMLGAQGLA
jgi:hypothetical protein